MRGERKTGQWGCVTITRINLEIVWNFNPVSIYPAKGSGKDSLSNKKERANT
jgi:hypothetical protein